MPEPILLTDEQVVIFGKPNFACAKMAKILIHGGVYKTGPSKAEYEQAVWIHWASSLLQEHGDNWRTVGEKILNDCANRINQGA